jgi:hypothetical protein
MVLRLKTRESRSLPGLLKAMLSRFALANPSRFAKANPIFSHKRASCPKRGRSQAAFLLTIILAGQYVRELGAGWSSPVARQAHNLKAAGSNPAPATSSSINRSLHRYNSGVNAGEKPVLRKKMRRKEMIDFFTTCPPTSVAIEACGGSIIGRGYSPHLGMR